MPLFNLPLEEVTAECQPAMALANDLNDYRARHTGDPADQQMALALLLGALAWQRSAAVRVDFAKTEKAIIQTFRTALVLSATADATERRP